MNTICRLKEFCSFLSFVAPPFPQSASSSSPFCLSLSALSFLSPVHLFCYLPCLLSLIKPLSPFLLVLLLLMLSFSFYCLSIAAHLIQDNSFAFTSPCPLPFVVLFFIPFSSSCSSTFPFTSFPSFPLFVSPRFSP